MADDKTVIVGKYKVTVKRDLCIGAASCVAISPKVFQLDSENKAVIPEGATDAEANILMAAQSCPTKAIEIFDTETNKKILPQE